MRKTLIYLAFALPLATEAAAQFDIDREPINYYRAPVDNVISRLQKRIDTGKTKLTYDNRTGYIRSVLAELKVPISSQGLVFSKTSLQLQQISPRTPRSVFLMTMSISVMSSPAKCWKSRQPIRN